MASTRDGSETSLLNGLERLILASLDSIIFNPIAINHLIFKCWVNGKFWTQMYLLTLTKSFSSKLVTIEPEGAGMHVKQTFVTLQTDSPVNPYRHEKQSANRIPKNRKISCDISWRNFISHSFPSCDSTLSQIKKFHFKKNHLQL